jgi:hypothetical protein
MAACVFFILSRNLLALLEGGFRCVAQGAASGPAIAQIIHFCVKEILVRVMERNSGVTWTPLHALVEFCPGQ